MKSKWINMYMDFAKRAAAESYSKRLQVGAIFVSIEGVMSIGINGTPKGFDNSCEIRKYVDSDDHRLSCSEEEVFSDSVGSYILETRPEVSHAEQNLFAKMMREGVESKGGVIFITHAPCIECAKQIVGSGIDVVYYRDEYRSDVGLMWLAENGVGVVKV